MGPRMCIIYSKCSAGPLHLRRVRRWGDMHKEAVGPKEEIDLKGVDNVLKGNTGVKELKG